MSVLAIIPARRGSKGIENKNFRMLAGKMLVEWTVEAAKKSEYVGKIVLSTDYHGGKILADGWGIHYHKRLPEHATDEAGLEPVMYDVVSCMWKSLNYRPEIIVLLQPTSPIRPHGLIDRCITKLRDTRADSVFTVHEGHGFRWVCDGGVWLCPDYDLNDRKRRQEREPEWRENGNVFAFKTSTLFDHGYRLGGRIEAVEIEPMYGIEIDEPFDLWMAKQVLGDGKS